MEAKVRAWKLFDLIPMMLLHNLRVLVVGRNELVQTKRILGTIDPPRLRGAPSSVFPAALTKRKSTHIVQNAAQKKVQGQVSRARQELTGASLAPRNAATLEELRRRPKARETDIPEEDQLELDSKLFAACLRSAPSDSASPCRMHERIFSRWSG